MLAMRIFLFRHAEKESLAALDPALTTRGQNQAQNLADWIKTGKLPCPDRLWSSPLLRARQTFEKIAQQENIELQIQEDLNERQASESHQQFEKRTQRFLNRVENLTGTLFAVTHLDWIDEALLKIPSDIDLLSPEFQIWSPSQYVEFEIHDGLWIFKTRGKNEVL